VLHSGVGRKTIGTDASLTCAHCGTIFIRRVCPSTWPPRFCSRRCQHENQRKPSSFTCHQCGNTFVRDGHLAAKKPRFCSRKCVYESQRKPCQPKRRTCICPVCDTLFEAKPNKQYCSKKCKRKRAYQAVSYPERLCDRCKKPYAPKRIDARFCSPWCKRNRKKHHRKAKGNDYSKRARKAGVVYDPSVTRFKVFERDNWTCKTCFRPTPKHLSGTCDDCAPELDHIIPFHLGGPHTWDNVRCLCRSCNGLKGAMEPDRFLHPCIIMDSAGNR
jgi:hypothetical protein